MRARWTQDDGGIVVGWLVKLALALSVFGLAGFDAVAVGVAHLNATDDASTAASAAASAWHLEHNYKSAVAAAEDSVTNLAEEIVPDSVVIDSDGTVHLKLRREITTAVMNHIGPLKRYTVVVVDGEASQPTS